MDGKYESPQNEYDHEWDHLDDGILYEFCKQTKYLEDFDQMLQLENHQHKNKTSYYQNRIVQLIRAIFDVPSVLSFVVVCQL